jgi:hypothetical protein
MIVLLYLKVLPTADYCISLLSCNLVYPSFKPYGQGLRPSMQVRVSMPACAERRRSLLHSISSMNRGNMAPYGPCYGPPWCISGCERFAALEALVRAQGDCFRTIFIVNHTGGHYTAVPEVVQKERQKRSEAQIQ